MKTCLVLIALIGAAAACSFPPRLWCSSPEIAVQCNVYNQCKNSVWTQNADAAPVTLELYYESLCPDCRLFIADQLFHTYAMLGDIMNVTLIPYGNTYEWQEGNEWKYHCQHGEPECVGNMLETCAIHILRKMPKIIPFVACMERSEKHPIHSIVKCAEEYSVPLDTILSCANSSLGNKLEHQMARKTIALYPPHEYVPWIVFNGVHTEKINNEARHNLLKLVCDSYKGLTPAPCANLLQEKKVSKLMKLVNV